MALGWIAAGTLASLGAGLAGYTHRARRRVEGTLPPAGRMVDADGQAFHVVEAGDGPPLVLIHGLGGTHLHFHALVPELARDHRVVAIDRPGSGYSPRGRGVGGGPIAQAAAIAALVDAMGLDRPVVVGHSLGGAVALALGLNHPDAVSGLAMLCPATQPVEEAPDIFRPLVIHSDAGRWLAAWTLATPMSLMRGEAALREVFAPEPVPDDFATDAGGMLSLRPEAFRNASLDLVSVSADLAAMAPRYGDLSVPAAMLFGRDDAIVEPAVHGEPTARAGLPLTYIDRAGHMIPITRPREVADWVRGLEREWTDSDERAAS